MPLATAAATTLPRSWRGAPEPDSQRYCAPLRCYCGRCPSWTPDTAYAIGETVVDIRHVASGKRRSGLTEYRNAQANTRKPGAA